MFVSTRFWQSKVLGHCRNFIHCMVACSIVWGSGWGRWIVLKMFETFFTTAFFLFTEKTKPPIYLSMWACFLSCFASLHKDVDMIHVTKLSPPT